MAIDHGSVTHVVAHAHLMAPLAKVALVTIKGGMASQSDLIGASTTAAMKVAGTIGSGAWDAVKAALKFMGEHSPTPGVDQFPCARTPSGTLLCAPPRV